MTTITVTIENGQKITLNVNDISRVEDFKTSTNIRTLYVGNGVQPFGNVTKTYFIKESIGTLLKKLPTFVRLGGASNSNESIVNPEKVSRLEDFPSTISRARVVVLGAGDKNSGFSSRNVSQHSFVTLNRGLKFPTVTPINGGNLAVNPKFVSIVIDENGHRIIGFSDGQSSSQLAVKETVATLKSKGIG